MNSTRGPNAFPIKSTCLLIILLLVAIVAALSSPKNSEKQTAISISAKPIEQFDSADSSRRHFGALQFRGGLVLSSRNKNFGGFSALRLQPDGAHFIALSDRGFWLRGRIVFSGNRPFGVQDAVMAPILDSKGNHPARWDTESIAEDGRFLYVGIERINSIMRFDYGRSGLLARAEPVPAPRGIKDLPNNKGLEALVFVPRKFSLGGTLIAFSEQGLDQSGNLKAFLIGGRSPGAFSIKRSLDFDISDAAILPDGDLLILERKFSLLEGISIRIRRIRLADVKPESLVEGVILFEGDRRYQLDNMEALSVHRNSAGEIILTMMSDDNFSILQRTLLLQFALAEK